MPGGAVCRQQQQQQQPPSAAALNPTAQSWPHAWPLSHTGYGVPNNVFLSPQGLGHAAWQGVWPGMGMPPAMSGEPSTTAPGSDVGASAATAAASWDGVMRRSLELGAPQGIVWHYQPTMSWAGPGQGQQGTTPLSAAVPLASHAHATQMMMPPPPPPPGASHAEPQPRAQVPAPIVPAVCSHRVDDDSATDESSSSEESSEEGRQTVAKAEEEAAAAESAAARASRELLATCLPSAEDGGLQQRVSQLRVALEAAEKRVENSTQEVRASATWSVLCCAAPSVSLSLSRVSCASSRTAHTHTLLSRQRTGQHTSVLQPSQCGPAELRQPCAAWLHHVSIMSRPVRPFQHTHSRPSSN